MLTTPKDVKPRVSDVDKIITAIEAQFTVDRRFTTSSSNKRTIEIDGEFEVWDRQEVCLKYEAVGWAEVTHRMVIKGNGRITIFTFLAEKE
jgi:hypothetical protein